MAIMHLIKNERAFCAFVTLLKVEPNRTIEAGNNQVQANSGITAWTN